MTSDALINQNAIFPVPSRGAERRDDLILFDEMATLPWTARHDNVTVITAFMLASFEDGAFTEKSMRHQTGDGHL